jgi:outer membrane protein OmpA-like peptidoglycan-associated protein
MAAGGLSMRSGNLPAILVLLLLSACSTTKETVVPVQDTVKDTVVLVEDANGTVGQVTVSTQGGARTLTVANTMVEVTGAEKSPSDPQEMDRSRIDSLFADSLSALPQEPVSFLLYFLHDSRELTAESKSSLRKVLDVLEKREFYEISIIGHTDTTGADEYNMRLSSLRAEAVRDALLSHGIRSGQIELRYHGKRDPLIPTGNNVREPRNRRVEVIIK